MLGLYLGIRCRLMQFLNCICDKVQFWSMEPGGLHALVKDLMMVGRGSRFWIRAQSWLEPEAASQTWCCSCYQHTCSSLPCLLAQMLMTVQNVPPSLLVAQSQACVLLSSRVVYVVHKKWHNGVATKVPLSTHAKSETWQSLSNACLLQKPEWEW